MDLSSFAWGSLFVKISLLLLAAWITHFAVAKTNPRWRVFLWRGTALGFLLVLGWTVGLPNWAIRVPAPKPVVAVVTEIAERFQEDRYVRFDPRTFQKPKESEPSRPIAAPQTETESVWRSLTEAWKFVSVGQILAGAWAIGFLICAARLIRGRVGLSKSLRDSKPAPESVTAIARDVAEGLSASWPMRVLCSSRFLVPFLYGAFRPTLVLPDRMCDPFYRGRLTAILAHELSHARSKDTFWAFVIQTVSSVLWFHPLAWKIGAAHRESCDAVCDAVAAAYLGSVQEYSRTLAFVALEAAAGPTCGLAMAKRSDVRRRLTALSHKLFDTPLKRRAVVCIATIGILGVLSLALVKIVESNVGVKPKFEATKSDPYSRASRTIAPTKEIVYLDPHTIIEGTVRDPNGLPMNGAKVALLRLPIGSQGITSRDTDEAGGFRLTVQDRAGYCVVAWAPNFGEVLHEIRSSEKRQTADIQLAEAKPVRLRVIDEEGRPIAKAIVDSPITEEGLGWLTKALSYKTDANGEWSVMWNANKSRYFRISKSGYGSIWKKLTPSEKPYAITLGDAFWNASGKVIDAETKQPIKEFYVATCELIGPDEIIIRNTVFNPDELGQYNTAWDEQKFAGPIRIEANGYAPSEIRTLQAGKKRPTINFELSKKANITGAVVSESGKSIMGAQVAISTELRTMLFPSRGIVHSQAGLHAYTDKNGEFSFRPQSEPFTLIAFHHEGFAMIHESEFQKDRKIVLKPWAQAKGTAYVDGKPSGEEQIVITPSFCIPRESGQYTQTELPIRRVSYTLTEKTDAAGRFAFEQVPPGKGTVVRQVEVAAGGRMQNVREVNKQSFEFVSGKTTRLDIRDVIRESIANEPDEESKKRSAETAADPWKAKRIAWIGGRKLRVSGKVTDAETMDPIRDFAIIVKNERMQSPESAFYQDFLKISDSANGAFDEIVLKGTAETILRIGADGYLPSEDITIPDGERKASVDVKLRKVKPLRVVVRKADGKPASKASLTILRNSAKPFQWEECHLAFYESYRAASSVGEFSINNYPSGQFTVFASDYAAGFAEISDERLREKKEITLLPWGRAEGKLDFNGEAGKWEFIQYHYQCKNKELNDYLSASETSPGGVFCFETETDEEGHFQFAKLPPGGAVFLQRRLERFAQQQMWETVAKQAAVISPGGTTEVTIKGIAGPPSTSRKAKSDQILTEGPLEEKTASPPSEEQADKASDDSAQAERKNLREFHVRGTVIDAETKKPIQHFFVFEGEALADSVKDIGLRQLHKSFNSSDGKYDLTLSAGEATRKVVRIVTSGYYPSESKFFTRDELEATFDVALKKGKSISGIVKTEDGRPMPNTEIAFQCESVQASSWDRYADILLSDRVKTDENGAFSLQCNSDGPFMLFARNEDAGFAKISAEDFSKANEIVLRPWGKVEGKLTFGDEPGRNERIWSRFVMKNDKSEAYIAARSEEFFFQQAGGIITDGGGRFSFAKLPPGEMELSQRRLKPDGSKDEWETVASKTVEVTAGGTTSVTLRGIAPPKKIVVIDKDLRAKLVSAEAGRDAVDSQLNSEGKTFANRWRIFREATETANTSSKASQDKRIEACLTIFRYYDLNKQEADEMAKAMYWLHLIGKAAVPRLCEELDRTDRGETMIALAFTLRAIGDPRATPTLIRAIPRSAKWQGVFFGLDARTGSEAVNQFLKKYCMSGVAEDYSDYVRAVSVGAPGLEISSALSRITGENFGELSLRIDRYLGRESDENLNTADVYVRQARLWADWWAKHWQEYVANEEDAQLKRIEAELSGRKEK